jgi:hypothetical protein
MKPNLANMVDVSTLVFGSGKYCLIEIPVWEGILPL